VKGKFYKSAATTELLRALGAGVTPCPPRPGVTTGWVQRSPLLRRVFIALGGLFALASVGQYAYGEMQTQALAQPQSRELYKHHESYQAPLHEDESTHQVDLDNRADMLGVEQDFFRGATNFTDPGYRDLPNAPQMQLVAPSETDHRTATGTQP
jgi:hypothetical protein